MKTKLLYFQNEPILKFDKIKSNNGLYFHYGCHEKKTNIYGYASEQEEELARNKSFYEMVERSVYYHFFPDRPTSSGMAFHFDLELAKKAAANELVERDCALIHHLCRLKGEVIADYCSEDKTCTGKFELIGKYENNFIVQLYFETQSYCGYIHVVSENLQSAQVKLLVDLERAHLFYTNPDLLENTILKEQLLATMSNKRDFQKLTEHVIDYKNIDFHFDIVEVPFWFNQNGYVVSAESSYLIPLYYGELDLTPEREKRLKQFIDLKNINKLPHPLL